jgi:hypothetical protein
MIQHGTPEWWDHDRHNFPEVAASAGGYGHNFREIVPI